VLIAHATYSFGFPAWFYQIAIHGKVGVTMFFVISGFLITGLLLNEEKLTGKIDIKNFYIRRALRILPVALLYILLISIWRTIENIDLKNSDLVHALTFTVNFAPFRGSWYVGHFWTLSVEEQFYLVWPAALLVFSKHLKVILIVVIIYSCMVRALVHHFSYLEYITLSPFFNYSDAIFVGALGAIFYHEDPSICQRKLFNNYFAQLLAVCLIILFVYLQDGGKFVLISIPFGNFIIAVSCLYLIFSYVTPSNKLFFKILNSRVLVHIGVLSYSIYIWQQFFFKSEIRVVWRMFPLNILIIYCVALISYFLWERPFLNIRRRFLSNKLQPAVD
jgi:peptidoglycan/LPS O-acetylase OafA/YrhL